MFSILNYPNKQPSALYYHNLGCSTEQVSLPKHLSFNTNKVKRK